MTSPVRNVWPVFRIGPLKFLIVFVDPDPEVLVSLCPCDACRFRRDIIHFELLNLPPDLEKATDQPIKLRRPYRYLRNSDRGELIIGL